MSFFKKYKTEGDELKKKKLKPINILFHKDKNISIGIEKKTKEVLLERHNYNDFFQNINKIQNIKLIDHFSKFKSRNLKIIKPSLISDFHFPDIRIKRYNSNSNVNESNYYNNLYGNEKKTTESIEKIYDSLKNNDLSPKKEKKNLYYFKNSNSQKTIKDNSLIISETILKNDSFDLEYDERMIFSRMNKNLKAHYRQFILERINYLKKHENNNLTHSLTREYEEKENNFILKLKSLEIVFENIETKKVKKLNFPFSYLPIFYYNHFQYFRYILLSLIQFSDDFENISYDEKRMIQFIKHSSLFKEKSNIGNLSTLIHLNLYSRTLYNNDNKYEKEINMKGNLYVFLWNTPKYIFKVQIRLPLIEAIFLNINKVVEHHANMDMICFLLENNFKNWTYYITNYFVSFKLFRLYYEENLSKRKRDFFTNRVREVYRITPLKIVNFIDSLNNKKFFLYFDTNKDLQSLIKIIHGFKLEIFHFQKFFDFVFSFNQMKILSIIAKYENLRLFFLKIIKENKLNFTITIDNNFFTLFDEKEFKNIYHFKGRGIYHKKTFNRQLSSKELGTKRKKKKENLKKIFNFENSFEEDLTFERNKANVIENENSNKSYRKISFLDFIKSEEKTNDNQRKNEKKETINKRRNKRNLTVNLKCHNLNLKNHLKLNTFTKYSLYYKDKKEKIKIPIEEKEQFEDLKEQKIFIYNPFVENYIILNNNIQTNTTRNIKYEIKITNFKALVDMPKYLIPKFLNDNPNFINKKENFGEFEEENIDYTINKYLVSPKKKKMKINEFRKSASNKRLIQIFKNPTENK